MKLDKNVVLDWNVNINNYKNKVIIVDKPAVLVKVLKVNFK